MTEKYNKYYDTYIKQKTIGAITGGYALQVDGNSNLNGNVNVTNTLNSANLNVTTLATCPTVISTDDSTNIATTAFVKTALSPYALIANLSGYEGGSIDLSSYITSTALTSALSSYITSSALSSYITSSALTSALSNYITSSDLTSALSPYALISNLSSYGGGGDGGSSIDLSPYALISSLSSYLTTASASSTYQTIAGMSSYLTTANLSSYLTSANAELTYQKLADMTSYYNKVEITDILNDFSTTSNANALYQTLADMENYSTTTQIIENLNDYLKVNDATTIYQPQAEMVDFLSKYDASVLYQHIGDMSNYVTNPSLYDTLSGYVTTSQANETYQIKSLVQPYTQLIGAGINNGYTTSAVNEVWGKNNNNGATGYFITNTYAGYTPSNYSGWNSGQGFYFAPVSGVYSINMNIFINSDTLGNKYLLSHYGNTGTLIYSVYVHTALATEAGDKLAPYSTMLKMNEGDYFKVTLSVRNGTSNWWFGNNPLHSSMTITKVS